MGSLALSQPFIESGNNEAALNKNTYPCLEICATVLGALYS